MFNILVISPLFCIGILDLKAFAAQQNLESKREIEKQGLIFCLNKLVDNYKNELSYHASNKPFLKGRKEHISVSHSHSKLVLALNRLENTGVDIELIRDKVQNVKHKFLNTDELLRSKNDTETLISFWAIKETLYKLHGEKELDFVKHLFIKEYSEGKITGQISLNGITREYSLQKKRIDDYVLIYALHEIC